MTETDEAKSPADSETKRLYNTLRKWVAGVFVAVAVGMELFNLVDDVWLGNHYLGAPVWITGIVTGIVIALFGTTVINAVRK